MVKKKVESEKKTTKIKNNVVENKQKVDSKKTEAKPVRAKTKKKPNMFSRALKFLGL